MMTQGTLVDATIIEAPSSTKNKKNERDPDMHQTKKGNEWHFGMKAHIGVDAKSGLTHTLVTTAANEHDLNCCMAMRNSSLAMLDIKAQRSVKNLKKRMWNG